jgi:Hint domain
VPGLPFTGTLEAPDGATVVSPLTTLVEKVIETSGDSVTQANAAVASALGLPAGIDLTTLDAVAGALSGDAASTAAFKAGSELLDAITLIQAAGGSPDLAYAALAADVAAGSTVNLADAATITAIGESAGLDTATAQAVASIASETAAALELQLAHAATPFEVFTDITGSSIAEQGDAATALSRAVGDTAFQQVADSYFQNLGTTLSRDDLTAAENVACYCPGTLIATDRGDIAVENLRVGGGVVVMSGSVRPIKWIGQRSYGGRFIAGRKDMLPICFKAGSLGEGLPRRDLWISPHHAMYLDGVLIEAKDLVNGVSVVQAEEVDRVDYFHIELDSHDVILAEGAWSETFVDDDSRGMFHNAPEFAALYPGDVSRPARYCAPRLEEGFEIEAIRRRLARLAGAAGASQVGALRGFVDHASAGCIAGWAQNEQHPEAPVCLDIYVRGQLVGHALANCYREDLREAGVGSGRHGFSFVPKPGCRFTPEEVLVKRSLDGVGLPITAEARSAALSAAA